MVALTHFTKVVTAQQTWTSTTGAEITGYTITWANLTGEGFAAADNVFILVTARIHNGSSVGNTSAIKVGFGTTYAGRTDDVTSQGNTEHAIGTNGQQYGWFVKRTLVVNENIYFTGTVSAGTAGGNVFKTHIYKLGDLTTNDWLYAENTIGGNAPTSYDTNGASASVPATGDWLLMAHCRFLCDDTSSDMLMAINDGTSDISEIQTEGEDVLEEWSKVTIAYRASLAASTTVRARYRVDTAASHDIASSKIFGLRLNAFENHQGVHTTSTITHSVLDTFQEYAAFNTFPLTTTGPLVVMGYPIHPIGEITKGIYGRIQIADADWPAASHYRIGICDNGAAAKIAPFDIGYNASQTSGTLNIDLDCAEDYDVSPTPTCTTQVAVAFSLTLASTPPVASLAAPRMSGAQTALFT